jgi:GntR family transcriptional regulator
MGSSPLRLVRTVAPLYHDVMTVLERAIRDGTWRVGEQIPTEPELEKQLGASRGTIRMAVSELVRKGLLSRQPGRGTFVLGNRFESLERFFRYEHVTKDETIPLEGRVLAQGPTTHARAARVLGLEADEKLIRVRRLRSYQGEPLLLSESFFSMETWKLIGTGDFKTTALYDMFKDRFGLYVVDADEYLTADLPTAKEAALLGIARAQPVVRMERTAHTFESRPIEFRLTVGRADRFRYHVHLQ